MPHAINDFGHLKKYGDWVTDMKTGLPLFFEKGEGSFVLRSEVPRFESRFASDEWDTRLYWSGAMGTGSGDIETGKTFATAF